jgi:CRP-like cAMP-binding protein
MKSVSDPMNRKQAPAQSPAIAAVSSLFAQVGVLSMLPRRLRDELAIVASDVTELFLTPTLLGEQGTPCKELLVIFEGALELSRGGRVFRRVEAGTIVGLASVLGGHPYTATVRALEGALVARLPSSAVEKAFRDPDSWEAMKAAVGRQGDFLLDLNQRFDDLAFERPPTVRLLRLLVRHAWETGGITARQVQLADYINSASADVSRAEASLTRQGLASRVLDTLWLTEDDSHLCDVLLATALEPSWPREPKLQLPKTVSSLAGLLWSNGWFPTAKVAELTVRQAFTSRGDRLGSLKRSLTRLEVPRGSNIGGGPSVAQVPTPRKPRRRPADEWARLVEAVRTHGERRKPR